MTHQPLNPSERRTGPVPLEVPAEILQLVSEARYHQPHQVLGAHAVPGVLTIRVLRPFARSVTAVTEEGERIDLVHEFDGIWVGAIAHEDPKDIPGYRLVISYTDDEHDQFEIDDPYRHWPTVSNEDLAAFHSEEGVEDLWRILGARIHPETGGTSFTVWAPNARAVRLIGDFNHWDGRLHAMRSLGESGIWELLMPEVGHGAHYKFQILGAHGQWVDKADPMARWTEVPPATASRVFDPNHPKAYTFTDQDWITHRATHNVHNGPISIYEVHAGSWSPEVMHEQTKVSYRTLADQLVDYVTIHGFTHVEFMPLAEHPFGGSWGYQVSGYYAPTSRYGTPDDFKYLVDRLHGAGIGVLVDWVPAHFPKDQWALAQFDGAPLYEYEDPRLGEHPDWGTKVFDFGRQEVRNFLISNALYWLEEFHVDGLRVDAVASMLYRDYSRNDGEWVPNVYGGNYNLEAISLLQRANELAYQRNPGIVMVAEESTAFTGVTAPTSWDGLGFGKKWNMGWMHDTLNYLAEDPVNRSWHHNEITFSMVYAYSEKYILPLSHDEVVHGKGALVNKFPGTREQQLATLRAYYGFMWAHPGKKLLFMGGEFATDREWSEHAGLNWRLIENLSHRGVMNEIADLNQLYRKTPALWELDDDPEGFWWIDAHAAEKNLVAFLRWDRNQHPVLCLTNFSGIEHRDHTVELPVPGVWHEIFNSNAVEYGGYGGGNLGQVTTHPNAENPSKNEAQITIPTLTTLYLSPR
ncbi:1,4-alpha-glucan branching protein GlgB [Auritidibacter ignavus]|uniref:1,4-alpha-glucan branching protein GlgB n=1 Tax=Auritidibacter ignavus TaxID=678932 RepID=UPI0024B8AD67|nr:1,4-alpha-glucan branching protein GlgB [Auritidibacter ignavus]WHS34225.1 1,4-alpha-glucan branching protein GlgB [Auritidibacter ignavus]